MSAAPARRDLRLLPVAACAWAAAAAAILMPAWAWAIALVAASGCAALLAAACGRAARGAFALAAVAFVVGAGAAAHVAVVHPSRAAAAQTAESGRVVVAGAVTTKVEPRGSDVSFTLDSAEIDAAGAGALRVRVPVRVTAPSHSVTGGRLDLGSRVRVSGGARATAPGSAEAVIVFAREVAVEREPPHVLGVASGMRDAFVALASELPGRGGELLPGLSVGDTRRVSDALDGAMKASSLSHLTAVSGANCALVVGLVFGMCAVLGARRGVRIVCALTALAAFVVLVTPEASVVRAAAMSAIAMLGLLLGRTGAGAAVLSLAVAVLVVADPWLALSFGFVLSVAATGALLLLAAPLAHGLSRVMPAPLALALAVPLAAQLACGPIIVLFAPQVPLYGVPANLIAGPAAPIATVMGLAACLFAHVPLLGAAASWIAWLPSAWVAETARVFEGLPRARLAWWEGAAGFAALAIVGGCIAVLIVVPPARRETHGERAVRNPGEAALDGEGPEPRAGHGVSGRGDGTGLWARARLMLDRASATPRVDLSGDPPRWARPARAVAGALVAIVVGAAAGGAAASGRLVGPLTAPNDWAIAACDVGQGDAVVVRSEGEVMLVDTGPEPEPLSVCLERLGIRNVDVLVLTHFDADHTGGAEAVAGRVGHVLHGPEDERAPVVWRSLDDPRREQVHAGERGALGGAAFVVRWPAEGEAFPPGNDSSVVIDIAGGGVPHALLLGDTSERSQAAMARTSDIGGGYDVVKVAHHGSADQDPALYEQVGARVALVSVGVNDYGHPRSETLDLLRSSGATIGRTDESGLVLVSRTGTALSVWRER